MSRGILHAKGRLSIEVLVATVTVREDMACYFKAWVTA